MENSSEVNVIYSYSREEAINDGVLVDITSTAKEIGFICPVAVTASVYGSVNEIPESFKWQDSKGRLWDLVNILFYSVSVNKSKTVVNFGLTMPHYTYNKDGEKQIENKLRLKCVAGPGDMGELVLTVMLPHES